MNKTGLNPKVSIEDLILEFMLNNRGSTYYQQLSKEELEMLKLMGR